MLLRCLSWLFLLAGGALLLAAGGAYYLALPEPVSVIDEPERTLDGMEAGRTTDLTFALHNPQSRAIRVIGLADC